MLDRLAALTHGLRVLVEPPLEVHDLTVAYHRRPVLWDIDFSIPRAKLVGVIGPNGAGKTTLIKAVLGMVPLASGWVKCFGHPVEGSRGRIGYVPQRDVLHRTLTVRATLDYAALLRLPRLGDRGRAALIEQAVAAHGGGPLCCVMMTAAPCVV